MKPIKKTIFRDKYGDLWRIVADDVRNEKNGFHAPFLGLKLCNDGRERSALFTQLELENLTPVPECELVHWVHTNQVGPENEEDMKTLKGE